MWLFLCCTNRKEIKTPSGRTQKCTRNVDYTMVAYFAQVGHGNLKHAEGYDGVGRG